MKSKKSAHTPGLAPLIWNTVYLSPVPTLAGNNKTCGWPVLVFHFSDVMGTLKQKIEIL